MKLAVQKRTVTGKKVKQLRKNAKIPGVVYGHHLDDNALITLDKVQFVKAYNKAGTSTAIELTGDVDELVLIQDIQLDPVSDHVKHVDLIAVKRDEKVSADVTVQLTWVSQYEKDGLWAVQLLKDSVSVEAFPLDLPHDITIDIAQFTEEGQVMFVKDLDLGDKVTILDDLELALVNTSAFSTETEEETTELEGTIEGEGDTAAPEAAE